MISSIGKYDVIVGRSGKANSHSGNKRFREMAKYLKPTYLKVWSEEKTNCSIKLLDMVHADGGRFLAKDKRDDMWYEVEFKRARKKARRALWKEEPASSQVSPGIIYTIGEHDVVMGRGCKADSHGGNKRFREMAKCLKRTYLKLQKKEKTDCSIKLVGMVHANDGRFLAKDKRNKLLYEVDFKQARKKASQALREEDKSKRAKWKFGGRRFKS